MLQVSSYLYTKTTVPECSLDGPLVIRLLLAPHAASGPVLLRVLGVKRINLKRHDGAGGMTFLRVERREIGEIDHDDGEGSEDISLSIIDSSSVGCICTATAESVSGGVLCPNSTDRLLVDTIFIDR